jgi:hypothetical protein
MKTKIYGGSDDLIEIEGQINDEVGCYDHKRPIKIECSDGTIATIFYDVNGNWKIEVKNEGHLIQALHKTTGEDHKHTGVADGCTSYSDVLIFDSGIEWVKIKGKKYTE